MIGSKAWKSRRVGMTPRQRAVYDLIKSGHSQGDAASILGISADCARKTYDHACAALERSEHRLTPAMFAKVDREIANGLRCWCSLLLPCYDHAPPAKKAAASCWLEPSAMEGCKKLGAPAPVKLCTYDKCECGTVTK